MADSMMQKTPRFLVTAGNTREMIDRVRDWGNIFTGNTGYAIAKALAEKGDVDLLTSNAAHVRGVALASTLASGVGNAAEKCGEGNPANRTGACNPADTNGVANPADAGLPHPIHASPFKSHAELRGALSALMARQKYDAIFMTAAVADYRPVATYEVISRDTGKEGEGLEHWVMKNVQAGKVKSNHSLIAVLGEQTEKLVDLFRNQWKYAGLLFKFKLEVGIEKNRLLEIGRASRLASGADYLVANTLEMVEGEGAGAYLISENGEEFVARGDLAGRLAREAFAMIENENRKT